MKIIRALLAALIAVCCAAPGWAGDVSPSSTAATMTATVGGLVPTPPNNTTTFLRGDGTFASPAGSGTVNSGTGPAIAQYPGGTGTTVGPVTVSGDATIAQGGALTVTKTNGSAFAASATTDTTVATNITSGTLPAARLPASSVQALTCSGSGCTFNTVTSADAKATMSASDTITITNCSTSPWLSKRFVLEVAQNSTGGFTPTLAAGTGCGSLYWPNGTTPTPTLTLSKADIYGFWFDGTNLHGLLSQPNETP